MSTRELKFALLAGTIVIVALILPTKNIIRNVVPGGHNYILSLVYIFVLTTLIYYLIQNTEGFKEI